MKGLDYQNLGLKAGFEIHQELDTHKLFCNCPSTLRDGEPPFSADRKLHPTESELGKIDRAALAEAFKGKRFKYEVHLESVCLVELDEEPPHSTNEEAVDIALEASLSLDATPVDEAHVMRKTVIDGSNTAGFQRTILIATDGHMEVNETEVNIPTICLEEDAARKVEESPDHVKHRLDRLGIPLLEIATGPDFSDPQTTTEAALKIGQILRATRKVKRGIGTIQQDVNVSIKDGSRQEIKGVQKLSLIATVIRREVLRQVKLLEIKEELERRGTPKVKRKIFDVTEIFSGTSSEVIKNSLRRGGVFAVKLEGFRGLLGKEIDPGRRFGTELSDHARTYGRAEGIFRTDELPNYGISKEEVAELKEYVNASAEDAVVIIAGKEDEAEKGLEAVINRANRAFEGVPEETRRALPDGNTQYMCPLPGAARMYVETDIPPIQISEERIAEIKANLSEKPEEKMKRYREEFGLSEELAKQMSLSDNNVLFEEIVEECNVDPTPVASTLQQIFPELEKEGVPVRNISKGSLKEIFELVAKDEISKDAISPLLKEVAKGSGVKEAVDKLGIRKMGRKEVYEIISKVVEERGDLIKERGEEATDALMGLVMKKIGGKTDGGSTYDAPNGLIQTSEGYAIAGDQSLEPDLFLLKTNSKGVKKWKKTYGGSETDRGSSLIQTEDGGFAMTGFTESFGGGERDVFTVKTDTSGRSKWRGTYGGPGDEKGNSVIQTQDDNFLIAGWTKSFGKGGKDGWLVKVRGG